MAALVCGDVKLYLYGKLEPRARRKMGHLTMLDRSMEEGRRAVVAAQPIVAPEPVR